MFCQKMPDIYDSICVDLAMDDQIYVTSFSFISLLGLHGAPSELEHNYFYVYISKQIQQTEVVFTAGKIRGTAPISKSLLIRL